MRILNTLFLLTATSITAWAQISINANEINVPVSPDTAKGIEVSTNLITAPTVGANQTWNYAALVGSQKNDFSFAAPDNNSNFSNATAKLDIDIYLGPVQITGTREYYISNASGTFYNGLEVAANQYNVDALTGGTGDIIVVSNTNSNFGTSLPRLVLPLQMGSQWSNDYVTTMNFTISVSNVGLMNEPGQLKRFYKEEYEVVGWGDVDLPAQLGTKPGLLLKSKITITDSLFLNGAPANPFLLAGLGLSQGFITEFAFYDIFIKGLNRSAIQFEMDATFTTVYNANYGKEPTTFSLAQHEQLEAQVYPNPAPDGRFAVEFMKPTSSPWKMEVVDLTGKIVFEMNIEEAGQISAEVNLPKTAGIYFYTLKNEVGKSTLSGKIFRP